MSEEDGSPYAPGSDDDRAYQALKNRYVTVGLGQVPAAWGSMVAPYRTDDQGTHLSIPGALTQGYNLVGSTLPSFANWSAQKLGIPLHIGTAPGAERAGEMAAESDRWAKENIPRVMPQNEGEERIADLAHNAAEFAIPGLGISKAPKLVQKIAHIAVPGLGGGVKGAILGAAAPEGIEAAMDYVHDAETEKLAKQMGVDPKTGLALPPTAPAPGPRADAQPTAAQALSNMTLSSDLTPVSDLTQPDTSHTVAHPEMGAPVNIPFPISSAQAATTKPPGTPATGTPAPPGSPTGPVTPDKYDTYAEFGRPDLKVTTPDFGASTGETDVSWGKAALLTGLGYAATSLAMRYAGKYVDPALKVIMGKADEISNQARSIEHNQRIAAIDRSGIPAPGAPVGSGADRGEAPLPGKAGYETTKAAQSLYDKNRVMTETAAAVAPNSGVAKQWEARIGTVNNQTPLMNRISEMMYSGVNLGNGGKVIPKLGEIVDDTVRAGPDVRQLLKTGLYAGDELDTRDIKWRQAVSSGSPLNDEALRHNFTTTHSDELRQAHANMMNNPEAAAIANRVYALQKANIEQAYEMGRITKQDMIKILKDRPRQIPSTDVEGDVGSALSRRDITATGWPTPPTTPIEALVQHYSKLYPELERNILNHDFLSSIKTWQDANPNRARIVTLRRDYTGKLEEPSTGPVTGRRIVTYKEGVPHVWEVDNSSLYRALKNNTAQTNLAANIADITRRSFQSGTTGLGALAGGRAFAPISLNRNILQLANDRFAGTSFGAIDRGTQAATGGRFGSRVGLDPSQWAGSYGEAVKGSAAVTGRAMSRALQNPNNIVSKGLRALVGDTWTDAWAKTLEHKWDASNAAMRRAEGVGGTGTGAIYDRPTYNIAEGKRPAYSSIADTMHNIYNPENVHLPVLHIPIPGSRATIGTYINVRNWMREIHREIAEGANSYYWKGMKDNPNITREQRAYYTRHVLGDPSMSGSGAIAENMTRLVPWANPSIQDAVRMMRNIRDNPISFALGTTQTLALTSAATILSAMLGGKKHINMLANLMSTHDRASNVIFFHDPTNEHNYTMFSLPQRLRMLNPTMVEGAANALGTFNMHPEEDRYTRIVHALSDMFSHHISHSTVKGTLEGVGDFADILQAPPVVQAGLALTGNQAHPPAGTAIMNAYEGKNPLEGMITKTDQVRRMHGQATDSSFTSGDDTKWVNGVLSNVFGVAAHGIMHGYDAVRQYHGTHDLAEATSGLLSNVGQSWRDNSAYGNMVWGNNMKMTQRNPMAEVNEQSFQKISHMPPANDAQLTGLTRRGGVPISIHGTPTINPDPQIVQMVRVVNNYNSLIGRTTEPQITDLKKQIADVNQNPHWSAPDKRRLLNELVEKKNALEGKKNEQIEKLNSELTFLAGGKRVNVLTFDQSKGMDQFR
jgi:hypothetical protein